MQRYPEALAANQLRAVPAYHDEDMAGAEEAPRKVLKVAPDYLPSMLLLGSSLYAQGKFEQARPPLVRYLAATPDNPAGRKLLGATYLRLGQPRDEPPRVCRRVNSLKIPPRRRLVSATISCACFQEIFPLPQFFRSLQLYVLHLRGRRG